MINGGGSQFFRMSRKWFSRECYVRCELWLLLVDDYLRRQIWGVGGGGGISAPTSPIALAAASKSVQVGMTQSIRTRTRSTIIIWKELATAVVTSYMHAEIIVLPEAFLFLILWFHKFY